MTAKVTAEAQAAPTDENETEAVTKARQSVFGNFAIPGLRRTTQARPAQADRNSVYGGADPPTGVSEPTLASQLASLVEESDSPKHTPRRQRSQSASLDHTIEPAAASALAPSSPLFITAFLTV